jgi:hypothetical protein
MMEGHNELDSNELNIPNYTQNTQLVIKYADHMHPLTKIKTPDLL